MKEIALIFFICRVLLLGAGYLVFGDTAYKLADAGSGQMAIVPPSTSIETDCSQASHVADEACNVQVQEYDTLAMAGLFVLVVLVGLVGFGFVMFAIGCITQ